MHSWTVYLLPYLGEEDLYNAYNFRQPHNAAANSTVANTGVGWFQCPYHKQGHPLRTDYGMVVTTGSMAGVDRYVSLADIPDGPGRTLMLAEMTRAGCRWTAPAAIVDPTRGIHTGSGPHDGASSVHPDGAVFLFADGQPRYLSTDTDRGTLRAMCTVNGDEPVDPDRH